MTISALPAPSLLPSPAVIGGARDWSWHEIHAAASELAGRLDPEHPVCNLCASRAGFLITWLAALRRGCLQLLPPSGGPADLVSLLDATPGAMVIVDDETLLQPFAGTRARGLVYLPQVPRTLPPPSELDWTPDPEQTCVCLYTSGTTGAPQPQSKTWGQLTHGARALAARLDLLVEGGLASLRALVCSVPPQHMFGFETSVLLPLVTGLAVLDRKPLLPFDVRVALEQCRGPAAWIATPLHLRALARSGEVLSHCRFTLVSTMPLAPALAAQVESLAGAPVVEIFGSTETGVIATRRTAVESSWLPIGDVRLQHGAGETLAWGAHFPSPHTLADLVEIADGGRFSLLGRPADMVKIGGRRASLAGLNLLLQDLPGLQDGVFYLPPTDSPTERLVFMHAGALDRAAAERWLRERMDSVFLPRAWLQVERLPRDANGKLPRAALDALHAAQRAPVAQQDATCADHHFRVAASHPSLPGHFPGRPIVPGVLILDHVIESLRERTGRDVTRMPRVKFSSPLLAEEAAWVQFTRREASLSFRVSALRGGVQQVIAEGSLVLGPVLAEAST
jgi:acyl-CoA synthetase (AMP-forming)/AMP-acid ligase II/3-hydroxymyristoyl/3-hydroxydecanoyl-(acyl carrier protein) dehydratase